MVNKLKRFLDGYIKSNSKFDKVNVFPLMCGVGKSTYLRYLISDAIRDRFGLIIITDRIDNLRKIATSEIDSDFNRFITDNSSKIAILSSDNIKDEWTELYKKPIVLMSTQRYFNLEIDSILQLTKNRNKIVFDEKPFILDFVKVDIKALNDIDTALKQGLNDTICQSDKAYLTDAYIAINTELQRILRENEKQNTGYKLERFLNPKELSFHGLQLEDYFIMFRKYKINLTKYDIKTTKIIEAISKLVSEGGIVASEKKVKKKSDENYDNYFYVVVNNSDKLTATNANVFVLDGTADISPEYTLDCFKIVDCSEFQRDLSKLNLNIIDINTSKNKLTHAGTNTDKYINQIVEYIHAEPERYNVLFTYQAIEQKFSEYFTTAHFGNIKGTNTFRNEQSIVQVGLSMLPHALYFLLAGEIAKFNQHNDLANIISDYDTVDNLMCKLILSDLEQNIFRGCIRNEANENTMNYMLFCNCEKLSTLTDRTSALNDMVDGQKLKRMIIDRYSKLGATIDFRNTPSEFRSLKADLRNTGKPTVKQKLHTFIDMLPKGTVFTKSEIMTNCGLTDRQYKYLRQSDELSKYSTDKQGIYRK